MKKKMIALLMVVSTVIATATGCGGASSGTAGKTAEEMQQEADMQYIADSIEAANAADIQNAGSGEKTGEEPEIRLVKMRDEIANGKITDEFVQIFDEIIPIDGTLTVEQLSNQISEMIGEEITYLNSQGASMQGTGYHMKGDGSTYFITDDSGTKLIEFNIVANSDQEQLKDLKVIGIACPVINEDNEYVALNMFYPSGICMGLYSDNDAGLEDEYYQQRVDELGIMNLEQTEEFISEQGLQLPSDGWDKKTTYMGAGILAPSTINPDRKLYIGVSNKTGNCLYMRFDNHLG